MELNKNKKKETCGIDPLLLKILVCPITKTELILDSDNCELISKEAGMIFPIRDGIPILLPEEAKKIKLFF